MVNGEMQCLGTVQHLKHKYAQGFSLLVKLKPPAPVTPSTVTVNQSSPQMNQPSRAQAMPIQQKPPLNPQQPTLYAQPGVYNPQQSPPNPQQGPYNPQQQPQNPSNFNMQQNRPGAPGTQPVYNQNQPPMQQRPGTQPVYNQNQPPMQQRPGTQPVYNQNQPPMQQRPGTQPNQPPLAGPQAPVPEVTDPMCEAAIKLHEEILFRFSPCTLKDEHKVSSLLTRF